MPTKFVCKRDGTINAIYSSDDKDLFKIMGKNGDGPKVSYNRASHVDPITLPKWYEWLAFWRWFALLKRVRAYATFGNACWAVHWLNEFAAWGSDYHDEIGEPFRSKREAEAFEVAKLERDHFKLENDRIASDANMPDVLAVHELMADSS